MCPKNLLCAYFCVKVSYRMVFMKDYEQEEPQKTTQEVTDGRLGARQDKATL